MHDPNPVTATPRDQRPEPVSGHAATSRDPADEALAYWLELQERSRSAPSSPPAACCSPAGPPRGGPGTRPTATSSRERGENRRVRTDLGGALNAGVASTASND